jgi:hypothetical protein
VVVLALLAAGCVRSFLADDDGSTQPQTRIVEIEPGQAFELKLGDTAELKGTNTRITFAFVSGDSRCPGDVVCVWQGEALILLSVNDPSAIGSQVEAKIPGLVDTPYHRNPAIDVDGFGIKLLRLNPYPLESDPIEKDEYRALLLIER